MLLRWAEVTLLPRCPVVKVSLFPCSLGVATGRNVVQDNIWCVALEEVTVLIPVMLRRDGHEGERACLDSPSSSQTETQNQAFQP